MRVSVGLYSWNGSHTRITVWVNGAAIASPGSICLRQEEVEPFVRRLKPYNLADFFYEWKEAQK